MIQIDPATLEKSLHFTVVATATIDGVLATIVLVGRPSDDELRTRNKFKAIGAGLK